MHLFLIRHGETVDNVAGLYAGSRDSPLTSHGVLQAQRLGAHLANRAPGIGRISHIFSSDLQRAVKTAEAVVQAQRESVSDADKALCVEKAVELRERDFRSSEGQKFGSRSKADPYEDAETHQEMTVRITRFVDAYLHDLIEGIVAGDDLKQSVVIVAHGIILNVLLKVLLAKYPPPELFTPSPWELERRNKQDHMAAWSNTGHLEAQLTLGRARTAEDASSPKARMVIVQVNCLDHLQGLRKTRGGIGSAKFDDKQKTMDSFFTRTAKKRKSDDQADAT